MAEIDLKPFCGTETNRPYLMAPFSLGEWTYATNGHIAVRVPRIDGVPEVKNAPNVGRVFPKESALVFRPLVGDLPKEDFAECIKCGGDGYEHSCPNCDCECSVCDGSGQVSNDRHISVSIGGILFALRYARGLLALPNIEWAVPGCVDGPNEFRFDGGQGVLMPLKSAYEDGSSLGVDLLAPEAQS